MTLVDVLNSQQLPWADRFALVLTRLGCRAEPEALFSMGHTLWAEQGTNSPESVAYAAWALWRGRN
jgi:hypothetical protein